MLAERICNLQQKHINRTLEFREGVIDGAISPLHISGFLVPALDVFYAGSRPLIVTLRYRNSPHAFFGDSKMCMGKIFGVHSKSTPGRGT